FSYSALAAVSYLRSLAAFVFPLFYPVMYTTLGFGMGDTILAVVAIIIYIGLVFVLLPLLP
ncbi:hypothetical protein C8R48DRAFT_600796, partial [Suillus tomentosus]